MTMKYNEPKETQNSWEHHGSNYQRTVWQQQQQEPLIKFLWVTRLANVTTAVCVLRAASLVTKRALEALQSQQL